MIYEIALLPVREGLTEAFRQAFAKVAPLLIRADGYRGHILAQGIEKPETFHLVVRWRSLEDHTPAFETSEDHRMFMLGLEAFLSEEPSVQHVEGVTYANGEHLL